MYTYLHPASETDAPELHKADVLEHAQPLLVKAAFSHLELALAHVHERVVTFRSEDDRTSLLQAADRLNELAVSIKADQHKEQPVKVAQPASEVSSVWRTPQPAANMVNDPCPALSDENKASDALFRELSRTSEGKICSIDKPFATASDGHANGQLAPISPDLVAIQSIDGCEDLVIGIQAEPTASKMDKSIDVLDPLSEFAHMTTNQHQSTKALATDATTEDFMQSSESLEGLDEFVKQETHTHTWFREQFMAIFDELDSNREGTIDHAELRSVFTYMGLPPAHAAKVFKMHDANGDGMIDRGEWLSIVDHVNGQSDNEELQGLMKALSARYQDVGHIYEKVYRSRCILRHDSRRRMVWDSLILVLLVYIALSLPLTFAFEDMMIKHMRPMDVFVDSIFMLDVCLNFITTYVNKNMEVVDKQQAIARNYLKTWFTLDIVSSVPLEHITFGALPGLQPAKLLKLGKLVKVLKLLRFAKLIKLLKKSEIVEVLEETLWSKRCYGTGKLFKLMCNLLLMGHWLACVLLSLEGGAIDHYFVEGEQQPHNGQVYLAALYWSMTTMTTVGYGDVVMRTDRERMFAVLAMIFGGGFYGYIIGSITTMVSQTDLNRRAFNDRMELVMAWLDFHDELPAHLRRKIWRHFKELLAKKTAVDDSVIMNDLSVALKNSVCDFLMHDDVRSNPLFENLPSNELSQLVVILEKVTAQPNEHLCEAGHCGHAMYIINQGVAEMIVMDKTVRMCAGDSFGEEILLNIRKRYTYTVVAQSKLSMFKISVDAFLERFKNQPDLVQKMKHNFVNCHIDDHLNRPDGDRGHASLSRGKSGVGMTASFPDMVMEGLKVLTEKIDTLMNLEPRRSVSSEHSVITMATDHPVASPISM